MWVYIHRVYATEPCGRGKKNVKLHINPPVRYDENRGDCAQ